MSIPLFILLIIWGLLTIRIIYLASIQRHHLTTMHGMTVSMTLGMLSGVFLGMVCGLFLHGNLFLSTVLSILIGLSIGFIAGLPFGIIAVIDGSVSGLMGGMMGAMLGEMSPMANPDTTLKLIAYFTTMLLLLILFLMEPSTTKQTREIFSVKKHAYVYIFVVTLLFFILRDVEIITISKKSPHGF